MRHPLSDQKLFALALHLKGFSLLEKYNQLALANIEKLAHILLNKEFSIAIEFAKRNYELNQKNNIHMIFFFDEGYPNLLKNIYDPPFVLFCLGNKELIQKNKISMVGTRKPSIIGVKVAEFISNYLSNKEITMVSGMAHGIDTACHKASYQSKGGTIGVLAHGLDYIYPKANHHLYQLAQKFQNSTNTNHSRESGGILFISEYPLGVKPQRYHFPKRNRIISGLSPCLLFIEGGEKSGALITCHYAMEQGREVFVFEHPFLSNNSGGKKLISEGAPTLSSYFEAIVEELPQNSNILKNLQEKNSFYMGNHLWLKFRPNKKANLFTSLAAA